MMNAYYDGSYRMKDDKNNCFKDGACHISWGIVFHSSDEVIEVMGQRQLFHKLAVGLHEIAALVETCLWLSSHGYTPEETTFTTDDETAAYGSVSNNENGYCFTGHSVSLEQSLERLVTSGLYKQEAVDVTWKYLNLSRFDKIKGHSKILYNLRCDYLAKAAFKSATKTDYECLDFDTWMKSGFMNYDSNRRGHWMPAFTGTILS